MEYHLRESAPENAYLSLICSGRGDAVNKLATTTTMMLKARLKIPWFGKGTNHAGPSDTK